MKRHLWLLPLFVAQLTWGQQPASNPDHELIQQLLHRVNELEAEVSRLKTAQPAQAEKLAVQAEKANDVAAAQTLASGAAAMPGAAAVDMIHEASGMPPIQIRGFSDIQYIANDQKGSTNSFAVGQLNLFMTSKLSDRFSVLTEMVIEADRTNAFAIDLERLLFQYSANDYFNLAFGRYHTGIGFYNTAYHHSTWMQTTVGRPFLFGFEDGGGILPVHNVGVSASGRIPSGNLGLHYVAELGNGRTSRSPLDEAVQNVRDENNGKSFNLAVFARPKWMRGFQTGVSVYHDHLTPEGLSKITQNIIAAHAVYQSNSFELLNEAVLVRHAIGGRTLQTPAFYSQISKPFNRFRPYFRYEYMNTPSSDPIIGDVGLRHGPVAGIRFDFSEVAAFKLEYNRILRRNLTDINGLATQIAFTF